MKSQCRAILLLNKEGDRRSVALPIQSEEPPMANPFVHVELNTQDVAKAKSFYQSLFD